MFATRFGTPILGRKGGTAGVDDAFAQQHEPGIGAEIMGAGKFGPPGGQDDAEEGLAIRSRSRRSGRQFFFSSSASITRMPLGPRM
jgi:hypothetical protein